MPTDPRRILLVRPSALGDVCRTVPVLASLRRRWPAAHIDWLVQDSFADAIRCHPDLNSVVPFPRAAFTRPWRPRVAWRVCRWLRSLGKRDYDLAFDLQGLGRSGVFTWCTGARRRVGFRDARELGWLGVNVHVDRGGLTHTVDQMLRLVESQGAPAVRDLRLTVPAEAEATWESRRERFGVDAAPVVLAPTSRWRSKQWPAERWEQLAVELSARLPVRRAVVVGAPGEEAQTSWAAGAASCLDLCGKLKVGETMALLRSASVVIANDSAPLHMAVGLGVPYVGLFGPTDPARVGPYRGERWVLRGHFAECERPRSYRALDDDDRLMRRISVEDVAARVLEAVGHQAWFRDVAADRSGACP